MVTYRRDLLALARGEHVPVSLAGHTIRTRC
jgi:hypothetical protein